LLHRRNKLQSRSRLPCKSSSKVQSPRQLRLIKWLCLSRRINVPKSSLSLSLSKTNLSPPKSSLNFRKSSLNLKLSQSQRLKSLNPFRSNQLQSPSQNLRITKTPRPVRSRLSQNLSPSLPFLNEATTGGSASRIRLLKQKPRPPPSL